MKKTSGLLMSHAGLILASFFFIFPFLIMVTTSLKTQAECFIYPIKVFPVFPIWQNYPDIFKTIPFMQYFYNTVFITGMNMLGVALVCPMAAYSFARLEWRGREPIFYLTLAVMMIPYQVIMVPIYMIFSWSKVIGTYIPLILPQWFGIPFFIFLLRQFFKGLPKDLEDAARIDGCSEILIYFRILLPLCAPAVLTIVIFQMLSSWNDFNGPLIYLQKSSMYTLQIGLQQFKSAHGTAWPPLMASSVLISLPIIIIFFFMQKKFMEGVTFSGIKG